MTMSDRISDIIDEILNSTPPYIKVQVRKHFDVIDAIHSTKDKKRIKTLKKIIGYA